MERLTPVDIFNKDFKYSIRGYDVDEVNEFLDLVIKNFEFLIEENRQLKEQMRNFSEPTVEAPNHDPVIQDILRRLERLESHNR